MSEAGYDDMSESNFEICDRPVIKRSDEEDYIEDELDEDRDSMDIE